MLTPIRRTRWGGSYYGTSGLFTAVPGTAIAYAYLDNTNAPVYSTWPPTNLVINTRGYVPLPQVFAPSPASQTAVSGSVVHFRANVIGVPPYTFQWLFGTNLIVGATNDNLALTNVNTAHAGQYSVLVGSRGAYSNSPPAVLSVVPSLEASVVPMLSKRHTKHPCQRGSWMS